MPPAKRGKSRKVTVQTTTKRRATPPQKKEEIKMSQPAAVAPAAAATTEKPVRKPIEGKGVRISDACSAKINKLRAYVMLEKGEELSTSDVIEAAVDAHEKTVKAALKR